MMETTTWLNKSVESCSLILLTSLLDGSDDEVEAESNDTELVENTDITL
jgi:hypothetical protein